MSRERSEQRAVLGRAEAALAQAPRSLLPLSDRASALYALGRDEEARRAYLEVLAVDPEHLGALLGIAKLCARTGQTGAAKTALRQAITVKPDVSIARSNLAALLYDGGEEAAARQHYEEALRLDPGNRGARQGLAVLLLRAGEREAALVHGRIGFGGAEAWPFRGEGRPVSLLLVISALGGNIPIDQFIDDRVFLKWTLIPEFLDPDAELPPHDLVFNGIGDADRCAAALATAAAILSRTRAPVLNPPARVLQTGRAAHAELLGQLPGVVTARTVEWSREALEAAEAPCRLAERGFTWPLLLRSPGFHTGQHFVKVDGPQELRRSVAALPGAKLLVVQFIDTRSADGKFRKYRVMMVDGRLYPLHLAVSARWKVHYVSADMGDSSAHRAEDDRFLRDMHGVLGPAVVQALERTQDHLGLDYGGIDFAIQAQGEVVVFEANATMVILPPAAEDRFAYRAAPVQLVQRAVRRMLRRRAPASST